MRYVSANDARQDFGALLETAQHEMVTIRRQDQPVAVVMSVAEYEALRRLQIEAFERLCEEAGAEAARNGLTERQMDALLADVS